MSDDSESRLVDVACHVLNDPQVRLENTGSRARFWGELFSRHPILMVQVVPGNFGPKVVICNHYNDEQEICGLTGEPCYLLHARAYPSSSLSS